MGKFSDDLSKRLGGKPENKNLAREAVERDRQQFLKTVRRAAAAGRGTVVIQPDPPEGPPPDSIGLEVGARNNLTQAEAESIGRRWRELITRYPKTHFIVHLAGYDEDPRNLWDFPEVCEYMQHFAKAAGILTIDDMPSVGQDIIAFFALCGAFGPDIEAQAREQNKHRVTEQ
jgi:hypothetical protein